MKCDYEYSIKLDKPLPDGQGGAIYNIPVACGKCLPCKKNRVNQWSFRLMEQQKVSETSKFVTLTYDTEYVPITKNGFMTLVKTSKDYQELVPERQKHERDVSLQAFIKRLRYFEEQRIALYNGKKAALNKAKPTYAKKISYYAVGEYGSKRKRPHYHIILFNVLDDESIRKAWPFGNVHIDEVNNNTIDYTLKYMVKEPQKRFKKYDAQLEFSIMSKGIGEDYLKKKM